MSIIFKLFHKAESGELFPNPFYEPTVSQIQKRCKGSTKMNLQKTIYFIKVYIKYLQTECKNTSKEITHRDQVDFIPESWGWLNIHKSITAIHHT